MPATRVVQFLFPATRGKERDSSGAAICTSTSSRRIAPASSSVSVGCVPDSSLAPPELRAPGMTSRRLAPSVRILSETSAWAPVPTDTIQTTAPTPTTIPSIVRALRSLFTRSDRVATRRLSKAFIGGGSWLRPEEGQLFAAGYLRRSAHHEA